MIVAPEPGIYPGVEPEVYFSWNAINNSGLTDFARSPARFRWVQEHPEVKKETKSTRLGSFTHCALLEPNQVEKRFAHCPGKWNTNPYKQAKDAAEAMDLIPLHTDEWEAVERIRDNVRAHPQVMAILDMITDTEISCVWTYQGHPVKQRLDILCRNAAIAADVKTSRSIAEFDKSIGEFAYYRQQALYMRGLVELGVPCTQFFFIVVENTPPYEIALRLIDPLDVQLGFDEFEALAARMIECRETGSWPGLPANVETVFLRPYHRYDIEKRLVS